MSELPTPDSDDGGNAPGVPSPPDPRFALRSEETSTAVFCHLASLLGYVGVPFGGIIGPLVVWLVKRDQSPFVDDHGRESVNFQITVLIAMLCCIPLVFVVIGIILLPVIAIGSLICVIIAAIKAGGGELYRYPMTIRFIS